MTSVPFKSELCDSSIFSAFPGPSTPRPISQVSFLSKGSKLILHYQVLMKCSLNLFFLVLLPFNHSVLVSKVQMGNKYSKQADQSVSGKGGRCLICGVLFSMLCPFSCLLHNIQASPPESLLQISKVKRRLTYHSMHWRHLSKQMNT